jgi:hypothetical protein
MITGTDSNIWLLQLLVYLQVMKAYDPWLALLVSQVKYNFTFWHPSMLEVILDLT